MAAQLSPLTLRIQAKGERETKQSVSSVAGSFDGLDRAAQKTSRSMEETAREGAKIGLAARGARGFSSDLDEMGQAAGTTTRRVQELNRESRGIGERFKEGARHAREMAREVSNVAHAAIRVHGIWSAIKSGSPVKMFTNIVPEAVQKKIAGGLIAKGVGELGLLATTIEPAMTKQLRVRAIEGITGSKGAAQGIYNQVDKASTSSVFDLGELTVAAKTLAKDRQFSDRLLKATDDLAAAAKDEGATPQDVARALGRLRAGDSGEALERMRDFGIGRPDLEAQGVKFDGSGALADKSVEGINKTIDAVVEIIEKRFGGLSEKLATETLAGSISNLGDAATRARTVIGEQFIPVLNWTAQSITTLATWFANLPEPIIKVIAWGTAFGGMLSIVTGALIIGTIVWSKIRLILAVIKYSVLGINFVLGLFGTSLNTLTMSILSKFIPSVFGATASIGVMALTTLGLIAAIAALIYVSKMYYDELQHGTETVNDARDAKAKENDAKSADAVRGAVAQAATLSDRDRYSVYKAAIKKAGELGDTELGDEINKLRFPLQKKLKKAGIDTGNKARKAETKEGQSLVNQINNQSAGNKAARLKGVDYLPKGSEMLNPEGDLKAWQDKMAKMFNGKTAAATVPAPGGGMPSGPMMFGAAEAQLRGQQRGDVQAKMAEIDQITADIQALQDKKRHATKEEKVAITEQIIEKQRALKAAKKELSALKTLSKQDERAAKLAKKGANSAAKYDEGGKYNGRIESLRVELEQAREVGDATRVESLTLDIEQLKALDKYDRAMLNASQTENAGQRKSMEAAAKRALEADKISASRISKKAVEPLNKASERDARMLARVDSDAAFQDKIFSLEEELEKAKEEKDAAQVKALTLQIARLKAQGQYEEDLINARGEVNVGHRRALEEKARKDLDIANRRAARDANLASMRVENEGKKKGKKSDSDVRDNAIRARLAMMNMSAASPMVGRQSLGAGINYGDRFAESDALRPRYDMGPLRSVQGYNRNVERQMDIGALPVPKVIEKRQLEAELEVARMEQNSRGNLVLVLKTGNIEIPIPRIGDLRGHTGGRR